MNASSRGGFTLIELAVVGSILVIMMAIALPSIVVTDRSRVNQAASEVREALQTARLRAVAVNHSLQVRFNCPDAGQYRIVEAGTWSDGGRCNPTDYPYPPDPDAAYAVPAKPRYDGPIKSVHPHVTLTGGTALTLQFFPDGRVMKVVSGSTQVISSQAVTVGANGYEKTINVNSLGKVITQ